MLTRTDRFNNGFKNNIDNANYSYYHRRLMIFPEGPTAGWNVVDTNFRSRGLGKINHPTHLTAESHPT